MSLLSRLPVGIRKILDAVGAPSPMGVFAEDIELGTRLEDLSKLGESVDPTGEGATVGADLIMVPGETDSAGELIRQGLAESSGGMAKAIYDPGSADGDLFARANHTGVQDADTLTYDNVVSGLTATDVQAAIDELAASSGGSALVRLATYEFETDVGDDSLTADGSMTVLLNGAETDVSFDEQAGGATILVGAGNNGLAMNAGGTWWMSLADLPTALSTFSKVWIIIEWNSFDQANGQSVGLVDSTEGNGSYARIGLSPSNMVADCDDGTPNYGVSTGNNSLTPAATFAAMARTLLQFGPELRVSIDGWDTGGAENPPEPGDITANVGPSWAHVGGTLNADHFYVSVGGGAPSLEIGRIHFYVLASEVP